MRLHGIVGALHPTLRLAEISYGRRKGSAVSIPMMNVITINVGGTLFQTSLATLNQVPDTLLSNESLLSQNFQPDKQIYFFDRDPQMFHYILNYYRTGELHLPPGACSSSIKKELHFWCIPETHVSECCWKVLYKVQNDMAVLAKLNQVFHDEVSDFCMSKKMAGQSRVRHAVWMFLEYPGSSLPAKLWEKFFFTLICTSTLVFMFETVKSFREVDPDIKTKCNITKILNGTVLFRGWKNELAFFTTRPFLFLSHIDLVLAVIFTIEFAVRFITCPRKCNFLRSLLNMIDLLFLLCKWPSYYMEGYACVLNSTNMLMYIVLKGLTFSRIFRLFRIGRSCQGFKVMLVALKSSSGELCLMVGSFICVTLMFAVLAFLSELREATFSNVLSAWWWAVVTMTTVGYGDIYPVSATGQVIASMCAVTGMVILTLPIAIIGTNFAEYYSVNRERELYGGKQTKCEMMMANEKKGALLTRNKIHHTKVTKF
ncbi:potassium voltage-gated channel protein egl-36-like [Haliotis rubra]|uniref:potassium voltage-gated channel protein egl-36-like n=1 Tax=Haliotis rubra TaxID=36100 RepID=UPI001EE4F2B0|nr:potassium voltage-gated channel protein egl-36-like [Haliotis rubra]